jgi:hypothetical protein
MRTLNSAVICIAIGLATYALIVLIQYKLKFFAAIGADQDFKERELRRLLNLAHPELSEKSQCAIKNIEARIHKAEELFYEPGVTQELFDTWTNVTAATIGRTLGRAQIGMDVL